MDPETNSHGRSRVKSTHEQLRAGGGNRIGDLATNEIWFLNQRGRPEARPDDSRVGRVGIEPTFRRIKNPLQGLRLLPTQRTVPPSGIEPEPLGLQPSAQTNYARVGCDAARPRGQTQRLVVGALPGTLIVIALRLSEITGRSVRRAQVAPRALRYSRSWRIHLSPHETGTTQS